MKIYVVQNIFQNHTKIILTSSQEKAIKEKRGKMNHLNVEELFCVAI